LAIESIIRGVDPQTNADDSLVPLRLNRRGELQTGMPWHVMLALEGKVYSTNAGSESTEFVPGNTAWDADQPEFALQIPDGTTVIPLFASIHLQVTGAALAEVGMGIQSDYGDNVPGTNSTAMTIAPTNVNPAFKNTASRCTAAYLITSNITQSNYVELWRRGYPSDPDVATNPEPTYEWSYLTHPAPALVGDAGVNLYAATASGSDAFLSFTWAEFETSKIQ
jgi:hypothetical protein